MVNISNWYLKQVILTGDKPLFEVCPGAELEIYIF
ncbi:DUF1830 domain-containing protein [Cyanobacteria bacterium FACHB-63]|nr:DUF1830 domain-containing protein [Cyanobacteria bacterium FACHB-DQ100]MBD1847923.1 DUF1830 domain-containing protein [Cyanobacteria bacterium FACHB-63]MBD2080414.1 DUF1830 domain-containing protein [Leptolyngbya sp. FACHB-17]